MSILRSSIPEWKQVLMVLYEHQLVVSASFYPSTDEETGQSEEEFDEIVGAFAQNASYQLEQDEIKDGLSRLDELGFLTAATTVDVEDGSYSPTEDSRLHISRSPKNSGLD